MTGQNKAWLGINNNPVELSTGPALQWTTICTCSNKTINKTTTSSTTYETPILYNIDFLKYSLIYACVSFSASTLTDYLWFYISGLSNPNYSTGLYVRGALTLNTTYVTQLIVRCTSTQFTCVTISSNSTNSVYTPSNTLTFGLRGSNKSDVGSCTVKTLTIYGLEGIY